MYQPISQRRISLLRSLLKKKKRIELNKCRAEGNKLIKECLELENSPLQEWFTTEEWIEQHQDIVEQIEIEPSLLTLEQLKEFSALTTPNGPIVIFEKPQYISLEDISALPFIIALDDVQDPGNVGTILRIADWFDAAVLLGRNCADEFSPKVIQSAMGAALRVPLRRTHLPAVLPQLKHSYHITGATLQGDDMREFAAHQSLVLVIGNESRGIQEAVREYLSSEIMIPRFGKAESLNAAVATGILTAHLKMSL